ncbi:MAG: amidohydrolase, partial [Saprospiraceae bacterium]
MKQNPRKSTFLLLVFQLLYLAFVPAQKKNVDLIVFNAKLYTLDNNFSTKEAIAITKGKIVATGQNDEIIQSFSAKRTIDAKEAVVYPGFIDAHSHFYYFGIGLNTVNLVGTKSWKECLKRIEIFKKNNPAATWITGRGWDQNDWKNKQYPDRSELDLFFPAIPVYFARVDGHAAIVNDAALKAAGITAQTVISGGKIELLNGEPSGILIDNATDLVQNVIPVPNAQAIETALLAAQQNCFAAGLTSVSDCGLDYPTIEEIEKLHLSGKLKMKLYVMLSDAQKNYDFFRKRGIIKTSRL